MTPANFGDENERFGPQLQNNYHRPNFPWVCGNAAIGEPCWTGPTVSGSCGCRADCYPVARNGSWACSRPAHRGGACSEGPTVDGQCCNQRPACVPKRSLRSQRNRLSFAMLCVLFGLGLVIYGSGQTYDVIAPGPLSSPHAQRMAHQGSDRCASCHPQAHQNVEQWIGRLVGLSPMNQTTQTDLCLNCHQRDLCQEFATLAHNVSPQELLTIREKSTSKTGVALPVSHQLKRGQAMQLGDSLACATCHREHHGQQIDMKAMTDQQCQSCHIQTFHRFELDHPEFTNWPKVAAQGIQFDHGSHHFKHFPQGNRPFECSQCHRDDKQGNVQQLVPFEQACADCHQGQIDFSSQRGFALLQLPTLDIDSLKKSGRELGDWPQALSGGWDGRLSPISHLLLFSDEQAAKALDLLGPDFDFLDLDSEDAQQMDATVQVAWGMKRLIADLSDRGSEAIRQRLQIVLGRRIDDAQLNRLTQGFSPTFFRDSVQQWFPEVNRELQGNDYSPISELSRSDIASHFFNSESIAQHVKINQLILARIRPITLPNEGPREIAQDRGQDLLVENPLAGLYGGSAGPKSHQVGNAAAPAASELAMPRDSSTLSIRPGAGTAQGSLAATNATPPSQTLSPKLSTAGMADDPTLLARNPLAANYKGDAKKNGGENTTSESSGNAEPNQVADPKQWQSPSNLKDVIATQISPPSTVPVQRSNKRELAGRLAGWIRDDQSYAIQYHLQGHADPWLKEWIDLLLQTTGEPKNSDLISSVVTALVAPDQAGNCLQCHAGNSGAEANALMVSWTGQYRDPSLKGWTKFNHRPHTLLPGLSDCWACHQLRETGSPSQAPALAHTNGNARDSRPASGFTQVSRVSRTTDSIGWMPGASAPHGKQSDFYSITKSQCANCHQAGSTRSGCTTCHNYHIGQRVQK